MQPISVTVGGFAAAVTDAIAASQTPLVAGNLTLTANPYVISPPRRVTITAAADESARTFTVYGTTFGGAAISEVIAGPNIATATSTLDFATVTRIAVDAATAGAVEAGLAQSGGSRWVRMDSWANAGSVVQVGISGTITYSVQTTMDDPNDPTSPVAIGDVYWLDTLDGNLVSESTDKSGFIAYTPTWVRIVGSGGAGTATMRIAQFGNATY